MPFKDDLFFKAGEELGYAVRVDSNGPQKIGKGLVKNCKESFERRFPTQRCDFQDSVQLNITEGMAAVSAHSLNT